MKVKNLTRASWRKGIANFALFAWKICEMCRSDPKIVLMLRLTFSKCYRWTDGPTNQWTWVGAGDGCISQKSSGLYLTWYSASGIAYSWSLSVSEYQSWNGTKDLLRVDGGWGLQIDDGINKGQGLRQTQIWPGHQFNWRQLPALSNTGTSGPQMRLPIGGSSTVYQHNSHCRGMALLPGALDWHLDLINVILRHNNDITLISRNTEIFC